MFDAFNPFAMILRDLEAIQVQIGKVQLALLDVSASEGGAESDERLQAALIRLEGVQRGVGEVQVMLLRQTIGDEDRLETAADDRDASAPKEAAIDFPLSQPEIPPGIHPPATMKPSTVLQDTETSVDSRPQPASSLPGLISAPSAREAVSDLQAWLENRGVRIKSLRTPSGVDAMADEAALFLGKKYAILEPFYAQVKQRLGGSHFYKWFKSEGYGPEVMSAICQLGQMLYKGGFLTQFRNVKNDKTILFEPMPDGRVTGFLTGGWLERYVFQTVKIVVTETTGAWKDSLALLNTTIVLPNGTETEVDILLALPLDRVMWFECKTGGWQTYVKQFKAINEQHFKLPPQQAALILADHLAEAERASAAALTSMSILHLTEFPAWLAAAL